MMGKGLRSRSGVSLLLLLLMAMVMVGLTASSAASVAGNKDPKDGCSVCRYSIINRLFDACFFHFCYKATPPVPKHGHAVMKRAAVAFSDWLMTREARAPKKNVPTDWWRPLGLVFWANAPDRRPSNQS